MASARTSQHHGTPAATQQVSETTPAGTFAAENEHSSPRL